MKKVTEAATKMGTGNATKTMVPLDEHWRNEFQGKLVGSGWDV